MKSFCLLNSHVAIPSPHRCRILLEKICEVLPGIRTQVGIVSPKLERLNGKLRLTQAPYTLEMSFVGWLLFTQVRFIETFVEYFVGRHWTGDGSKPFKTYYHHIWGNTHPLTDYFRIHMDTYCTFCNFFFTLWRRSACATKWSSDLSRDTTPMNLQVWWWLCWYKINNAMGISCNGMEYWWDLIDNLMLYDWWYKTKNNGNILRGYQCSDQSNMVNHWIFKNSSPNPVEWWS